MSDEQPAQRAKKPIHCPKCNALMEKVTFQEIVVDRCTSCRGIWFDALEKEHLAKIKGSEAIDVATSTGPKPTAHMPKLICPICHTRMIEMVDHLHSNLHYESCTVCYGVFFNPNEFRQYKEHSILQVFSDWLHR